MNEKRFRNRAVLATILAGLVIVGICLFFTSNAQAAKHKHSYQWKTKKSATCSSEGLRSYECSCGTVSKTETIPKTAHTWNVSKPTCTTAKYCTKCQQVSQYATGHSWNVSAATCTTDKKCTKCGHVMEKAKGHTWNRSSATCTADKKCKTCGQIGEAATGHTWNVSNPTCTTAKFCTKCQQLSQNATGHTWNVSAATCTTDKKCTKCGHVMEKAKGHTWDRSKATCTADKKCKTCGYVTEAATGHTWNVSKPTCTTAKYCTKCQQVSQYATGHTWNVSAATCTTAKKCTVCGHVMENAKGHTWDRTKATCTAAKKCKTCGQVGEAATGHTWNVSTPTCTTAKYCITCQQVYQYATGHTWNIDAATCTTARSCTKCGHVIEQAKGHSFSWVITKNATCTANGSKAYKCACGTIQKSESIPKKEHRWNIAKANCTTNMYCMDCGFVNEKATGHTWNLTEPGCKTPQKCTICGYVAKPATGHLYAWTITKEEKCTIDGQKVHKCIRCGDVDSTAVIPAPGHSWNVNSATCTEAKKCNRCGLVLQQAKGHSYLAGAFSESKTDSSTHMKYCTECKNWIDGFKHVYDEHVVVDGSGKPEGQHYRMCSDCKHLIAITFCDENVSRWLYYQVSWFDEKELNHVNYIRVGRCSVCQSMVIQSYHQETTSITTGRDIFINTIVDMIGLTRWVDSIKRVWTALEICWSAKDIGDKIEDYYIQKRMPDFFNIAVRLNPDDPVNKDHIKQFSVSRTSRFRKDEYIIPEGTPCVDHNGVVSIFYSNHES